MSDVEGIKMNVTVSKKLLTLKRVVSFRKGGLTVRLPDTLWDEWEVRN